MNYLDARAMRYRAEAAQMEAAQQGGGNSDQPPTGWREVGATKKVDTVDDFAGMLSGNMNRVFRD